MEKQHPFVSRAPEGETFRLQRTFRQLLQSATPGPSSTTMSALLRALLEATGAQQGAFFLYEPAQTERPGALHPLAQAGLSIEHARALIQVASVGPASHLRDNGLTSVQTSTTDWLLITLPLPSAAPLEQSISSDQITGAAEIDDYLGRSATAAPSEESRWLLLLLGQALPAGAPLLQRWTERGAILAPWLLALSLQFLLAAERRAPTTPSATSTTWPSAELLATFSHELRSPLTVITSSAATLLRHERRLPVQEQRLLLQTILEAGGRLARTIERLLELAELEAGLLRLERMLVDPLSVVREALLAAEEQVPPQMADAFRFTLIVSNAESEAEANLPPVLADRRRLREVLDHLLENAIRFSPDGGEIRVVVDLAREEQHLIKAAESGGALEPSLVQISVADQGQGIPAEQLERVFERFYRLDTSLTRTVNGLGLGLTICKALVEGLGGRIWAERRTEGGSILHLILPASASDAQPSSATSKRLAQRRRRHPHAQENNDSEC